MATQQRRSTKEDHPLVTQFVNHLRKVRGLSGKSILVYTPYIRALLASRVSEAGELAVHALDSASIQRFLLQESRSRSGEYVRLLATAIRSFLRFLFLYGHLPEDISRAVPSVCKPRRGTMPVFLSPTEMDLAISTTNTSTASGRRNRAVLLLLARLGLRAGEIVLLELGDIRWRTGELIVRGKGRIIQALPLVTEVGEALAQYLHDERRCSEGRRVFLRLYPPYEPLTGPAAVGHIVRAALKRANVKRSGRGAAHLFRHGLATQMIRDGAPLPEIAQVLRHHSVNTTAIYAHVSFEALRSVAGCWPAGGVQ